MNIEELREYCLSFPFAEESFPFDDETLVMKVRSKVFALLSLDRGSINVKCDPEKAIEQREKYPDVLPGYHMNKKHWNTIIPNGSASDKLIREWIRDSYDLVWGNLPKRLKV